MTNMILNSLSIVRMYTCSKSIPNNCSFIPEKNKLLFFTFFLRKSLHSLQISRSRKTTINKCSKQH